VVQVASLSSSSRATALVADLRKAKYPAFQESVRIGGRQLYRIRIGPEADRRLAEAMATGVNKRFGLQSRVVSYP
jgi:DedD protein